MYINCDTNDKRTGLRREQRQSVHQPADYKADGDRCRWGCLIKFLFLISSNSLSALADVKRDIRDRRR